MEQEQTYQWDICLEALKVHHNIWIGIASLI